MQLENQVYAALRKFFGESTRSAMCNTHIDNAQMDYSVSDSTTGGFDGLTQVFIVIESHM